MLSFILAIGLLLGVSSGDGKRARAVTLEHHFRTGVMSIDAKTVSEGDTIRIFLANFSGVGQYDLTNDDTVTIAAARIVEVLEYEPHANRFEALIR